jgi:hypothetical protein
MDTINYAPIPDFNTNCTGFSTSVVQTDLSICDSTQIGYPGFCFITSDIDSVWGNNALDGKDYTWGGGTKFMAGKVFKDSLAQIWMADSLSFSAADTVSFGAMVAAISPQLENAFRLILEIREVGGNIVFSDTLFVFRGNDLWIPIYKNWICSQTGIYAFSLSVLAGNQADALFAMDNVGIRIVKNQNDIFPIIQHATYTQNDSTLHFKIANASLFTSLIWENSITGIVSIGVPDTLDMPAISGMQYSISGQKAVGCMVKNGPVYWSHTDQDSVSWNSNRVTPDTVGILRQHVWTMEHCGLEYTISSVSCQTISLPGPTYSTMNSCTPQNSSPTVDVIISGFPNPGCYLIDKGVLYWYQVGSLPNNTYLDTLFPSIPITVLNNSTNQQQQFTGVLRGQEPTGMLFGPFVNSWLTSWSVDITPIISGNATYTISGLPQGSIFSGETLGASILVAYTNLLSNSMGYLGVNEALFVRSFLTSVQMRLNNLCPGPVTADAFTIAALDAGNNPNVTVANQVIPTGGNHCYSLYTSNPTNIPPGNNPFVFSSYYNGPSGMYWQSPCTQCDILPTNVLASNDGPVCLGGTLNLSLSFTDNSGNIPSGPLNFTFFWQGPNGFTSNLQNPQISPMTSANYGLYSAYIVVPGMGNNCPVLGPFTTNVISPNHANLGANIFTCIPLNHPPAQPINVTIGNLVPPNMIYLWNTGATTQTLQIDGNVAACYWVQITDPITNCISVSNTICNIPVPTPDPQISVLYDCNTNCYTLTGTNQNPSQGPYTYNWNYTDQTQQSQNIIQISQNTFDVIGPAILCYGNTNNSYPYSLTISTNGCNSIAASGTIQHVDWNNVNSPDIYVCPTAQVGDPLFLQLQTMGFSFLWTAPNGNTFSTLPNPIVSSGNPGPGAYMVSFNHPDGCTGFDEFVVSACCHFSNGEYTLFDQDVVGGNTFPPGSEVVVQGTIFIENQVTWQNMKVWMQPGAKIVITPSTTVPPISPNRLILDNTTIKSDCNDQLWDCIEVQSDPVVTGLIQNGLLVTNNSLIEDARAAIHSKDGGFFAVLSSRLNRNWVHVRVDDFTALNSTNSIEYHPGIINNSTLSCSSELIPANSGQRSLAGVYLQNANPGNGRIFSINGPTSPNYSTGIVTFALAYNFFSNMHYGVYSENSDLYVQRSDFKQIYCDNNYPTPNCQLSGNGDFPTAIMSRANSAKLEVKDCRFENTRNGITAIAASNVNIRSNSFNNMLMIPLTLATDRNIWIRKSPQFSTVNIISNTMNHGRVGIFLDNNLLSTIITAANTIDHCQIGINSMGNASSDIRLGFNRIKSVPVYTPNLQLTHQAINAVENATNRYLIFRNTLEAKDQGVMMTGGAGKFQVWANAIQMQYNHNLLPNQGIWSVGMVKPQFSKNIINGPGFYVPSSTINNLTGIRFTRNVNPRLYCNETYLTRDNMTAEGNNIPSEVRRNKFTWSRVGFLFLNNGRTGPQLNLNHTTDNEFHCPFYVSSMRGENSPGVNGDIFYFSSGLPQFDPSYTVSCIPVTVAFSSDNPLFIPNAMLSPNPILSDYSSTLDFCNTPGVYQKTSSEEDYEEEPIEYPEAEVSDALVEYLHQALDSLVHDSLEISTHYLKKNVFAWLGEQDSLVLADSILGAFYDRESGGVFALMQTIQQAIGNGNYGYASELMENFPQDNEILNAYFKLFELQLNLYTQKDIFPPSESFLDKLQLVAAECQTQSGNAVLTARAMLLTLGIEPVIPECDLELLDSLESDSVPPAQIPDPLLTVYPNPADTEVTMEHDAEETDGYHIVVTNTMGNIIYTADFPVSEREINWNTTSIIQGAYYVLLYHEDNLVDYKLLSIIH